MTNLTLTLDDRVYALLESAAAAKGVPVDALASDTLARFADEVSAGSSAVDDVGETRRRAVNELFRLADATPARFGPHWKWNDAFQSDRSTPTCRS